MSHLEGGFLFRNRTRLSLGTPPRCHWKPILELCCRSFNSVVVTLIVKPCLTAQNPLKLSNCCLTLCLQCTSSRWLQHYISAVMVGYKPPDSIHVPSVPWLMCWTVEPLFKKHLIYMAYKGQHLFRPVFLIFYIFQDAASGRSIRSPRNRMQKFFPLSVKKKNSQPPHRDPP